MSSCTLLSSKTHALWPFALLAALDTWHVALQRTPPDAQKRCPATILEVCYTLPGCMYSAWHDRCLWDAVLVACVFNALSILLVSRYLFVRFSRERQDQLHRQAAEQIQPGSQPREDNGSQSTMQSHLCRSTPILVLQPDSKVRSGTQKMANQAHDSQMAAECTSVFIGSDSVLAMRRCPAVEGRCR